MNVEDQIKDLIVQIRARGRAIRLLRALQTKMQEVPEVSFCGGRIDFDNMPHPQTIKLIRAVGGKWSKTAGSKAGTIDYKTSVNGVNLCAYNSAPPPSCRIVEVEIEVPEQVIPAHKKKVAKMICQSQAEPVAVAVAFAQPK